MYESQPFDDLLASLTRGQSDRYSDLVDQAPADIFMAAARIVRLFRLCRTAYSVLQSPCQTSLIRGRRDDRDGVTDLSKN